MRINVSSRAFRALKKSVEHWERLVAANTVDEFMDEGICASKCALCKLYFHNDCKNCPVYQITGGYRCKYTPYEAVYYELIRRDILELKLKATRMLNCLKRIQSQCKIKR